MLDWGNYTAVDPSVMVQDVDSKLDSFGSLVKEVSPTRIFMLLLISNVLLLIQYLSTSLYISLVPGNKFTNGILFGIAEIFGMGLSQVLVSKFNDMTALYISVVIG